MNVTPKVQTPNGLEKSGLMQKRQFYPGFAHKNR